MRIRCDGTMSGAVRAAQRAAHLTSEPWRAFPTANGWRFDRDATQPRRSATRSIRVEPDGTLRAVDTDGTVGEARLAVWA